MTIIPSTEQVGQCVASQLEQGHRKELKDSDAVWLQAGLEGRLHRGPGAEIFLAASEWLTSCWQSRAQRGISYSLV